jgi:hypothetical protein
MLAGSIFLLVLAATPRFSTAADFYIGRSCVTVGGNFVDFTALTDGAQPRSGPNVSGNIQIQGYCGQKEMVTIPCTPENKDCAPEDCKCFNLAGNSGAASVTGAVVTAGAALVALLV